ncbi:MAG TPA: Rne/Rng family ribonuclease, partial [Stellaceae bacterium]|nr:Rne/Rng family ribonuclease [Stellaceae bacterium]
RDEVEAAKADEEEEQREEERSRRNTRRRGGRGRAKARAHAVDEESPASQEAAHDAEDEGGSAPENDAADANGEDGEAQPATLAESVEADVISEPVENGEPDGNGDREENGVEQVGSEDALEEAQTRRRTPRRQYKIQEVIKRRQIMLVQVAKEERGNKGAALTTYLSLAGRYCVLMPNTARGGGVSRKITSVADRRRLKEILEDLDIPDGMGVIVRTAGSERSKAEIKRDYEYLMRLWSEIRELTLKSTAPALIHEEGNLIKRSIRDLYTRDIDEVIVEGDEGYKTAKAFMRMLMPSHARRVQAYRDPQIGLFHRLQVESQIDAAHSPIAQLRSGGYIVLNQTEALVSIDVNSGRATRERNIEETALRTNLEAADEIARQLRLRDLAGLIVIDFIDMEEHRHNAAVERRLKEALKNDRARIQVGRISAFGLMEMSRQRLRPSLAEASTQPCPHCGGTGFIRSTESTALYVLRSIEEEGARARSAEICVYVPTNVALYILNQKRISLSQIEARYGLRVVVGRDDTLIPPNFRLERLRAFAAGEAPPPPRPAAAPPPEIDDEDEEDAVAEAAPQHETEAGEPRHEPADEEHGGRRRRRRRSRRGEEGREPRRPETAVPSDEEGEEAGEERQPAMAADDAEHTEHERDSDRRRRRRGRRGGRWRDREGGAQADGAQADDAEAMVEEASEAEAQAEPAAMVEAAIEGAEIPPAPHDEILPGAHGEIPFAAHDEIPPAPHDEPSMSAAAAVDAPADEVPADEVSVADAAESTPIPPPGPEPEREREREPEPVLEAVGAGNGAAPEAAAEAEPPPAPRQPAVPEGVDIHAVTEKPAAPRRGWWTRLIQ